MKTFWMRCKFSVAHEWADAFSCLLAESLDHPVEIQDAGTLSTSADEHFAQLVISFDGEAPKDLESTIREIGEQFGQPIFGFALERREDNDWKDGWKAYFEPQLIANTLCIYPPWAEAIESDYQIQIDPGLAFGTGTHETTKMMLTLMIKHLKDAEKTQVLDLGAGSGILSIAGTLFGHEVRGVEIDGVAVENARTNLSLNGMQHVEQRVGTMSEVATGAPWVFANILARIILDEAEHIKFLSHDFLLMSGFLTTERELMTAAFSDFTVIDELTLGPWGSLLLRRTEQAK